MFKQLSDENARLKKLVADLSLDEAKLAVPVGTVTHCRFVLASVSTLDRLA